MIRNFAQQVSWHFSQTDIIHILPLYVSMSACRRFYRSEHVLRNLITNTNIPIRLEYRPSRYMFGLLNYGEIPGYYNRADKDPWDVFAPGYKRRLECKAYQVTRVLGVLWMSNGNHKIAVRVDAPGFDEAASRKEIDLYERTYVCKMQRRRDMRGLKGEYRPISSPAPVWATEFEDQLWGRLSIGARYPRRQPHLLRTHSHPFSHGRAHGAAESSL